MHFIQKPTVRLPASLPFTSQSERIRPASETPLLVFALVLIVHVIVFVVVTISSGTRMQHIYVGHSDFYINKKLQIGHKLS